MQPLTNALLPVTISVHVCFRYIQDNFFFPSSLLLETRDRAIIGGHVNDHVSVLLRLDGLEAIMRSVIKDDRGHMHGVVDDRAVGPSADAIDGYLFGAIRNRTGYYLVGAKK